MEARDFSASLIFKKVNSTVFKDLLHITAGEIAAIWALFIIEFPIVCLAIYGLYLLIRTGHVVSMFVVNLFISDIIQICFRPLIYILPVNTEHFIVFYIYHTSIMASIGFMVCISLERYIMIAYPLWYRFHNKFKYSLCTCLLTWALSLSEVGTAIMVTVEGNVRTATLMCIILLLLPYPLVVLSFLGSWRALSHSISIPPDEQKRILRILALVLFNYTIMFLPSTVFNIMLIACLENRIENSLKYLQVIGGVLVCLSPCVDCLLYVFMRKDIKGIPRSLCCGTSTQSGSETLTTTENTQGNAVDV